MSEQSKSEAHASGHGKSGAHGGYPTKKLTPEEVAAATAERLAALQARYGDRLPDILDADLIRSEMTYDDYIETPTLLSLQQTLTDFHDELIFKVYHQQTELWFKLILHELDRAIRVLNHAAPDLAVATESVSRVNRYFDVLAHSYSVMLDGLSSADFMVYRKAFMTSSGFQSAQFRVIEIRAGMEKEGGHQGEYYWERAARHAITGEPTLTLIKFKEQYLRTFDELYRERSPFSLRIAFGEAAVRVLGAETASLEVHREALHGSHKELSQLAQEMIRMDDAIVDWKQQHLKVAAKHLKTLKGTGETNWAEYLAHSIREKRCFPELAAAKG